jgi:hypothetical protein
MFGKLDAETFLRIGNPLLEVVTFRASCLSGVAFWGRGSHMAQRKETTIERIYREVTGNKMPTAVKRALLPKPKTERQWMDPPVGKLTMLGDEWIRTLADGRRVKFTYQELDEWVFITAQVERNKVVYSIVLTDPTISLSRGEVESQFEGELSKKS